MKRIIFLFFGLMVSGGVFALEFPSCSSRTEPVVGCTSLSTNITSRINTCVNRGQIAIVQSLNCDSGSTRVFCATESNCSCPAGTQLVTQSDGSSICQSTSSSSSSSAPSECPTGEVKNIVSGLCEPLTQCTYPQLYNSLDNSCRTNEANCAINTVPIPFSDACNVLGNPECPTGWILSDVTGSHCLPDPDAPPTSSAPNHGGSSSSDNSSSAPSEPSTSSGSTSSSGSSSGNDSGGGDGSGNGSGDGNGSGNQSSSGSGSGGGGGAGQCDPTAKNYFDCIAGPTQAYAGLGDIPQLKGFSFDETEQLLQDKKAELQSVMEDIRAEAQSLFDFNLNSGGGALTDTCLQIFNVEVCFGWSKFSEGLQLLANVIFFICAFIAFAIVIRR